MAASSGGQGEPVNLAGEPVNRHWPTSELIMKTEGRTCRNARSGVDLEKKEDGRQRLFN